MDTDRQNSKMPKNKQNIDSFFVKENTMYVMRVLILVSTTRDVCSDKYHITHYLRATYGAPSYSRLQPLS